MEAKTQTNRVRKNQQLVSIVTPSERLIVIGLWHLDEEEVEFKKSLKNHPVNLDYLITLDNSNNLIYPADIPHLQNIIDEVHDGKSVSYHFRIITAQGKIKMLHGFGSLYAQYEESRSIHYDAKSVYEKLHLKIFEPVNYVTPENILEVVFNTFRTAIGVFTAIRSNGEIADFKWILANDQMLSISGYTDLTNKLYSEVFEDFSSACSIVNFKQVVETGIPFSCEGTSNRNDSKKWFTVTATKLADGFILHLDDITERKINERKLEEGAKLLHSTLDSLRVKNEELKSLNDELTSFAYAASHDLREPIRKIQVFSQRITETENNNLSDKGQENFKRILGAVGRMNTLIDNILSFFRIHSAPRENMVFDFNSVVRVIIQELKPTILEKDATIEFTDLASFRGNASQFSTLIQNLLENSLRFQKPGNKPRVKITTTFVSGKEIDHPKSLSRKKYLKLEISDNGIGFEQEYESRIFQMFQRLHGASEFPGSGMGLAICKKIVEKHKGFIIAKGNSGSGAVFTCYLPVPNKFSLDKKSA